MYVVQKRQQQQQQQYKLVRTKQFVVRDGQAERSPTQAGKQQLLLLLS